MAAPRERSKKDVGGRAKPHGRQLSAALLGVLSPSRVIPAEAGTQVYRGERHHAKLALGPRFRGDDVNFVAAGPGPAMTIGW
jgi:hypothetical protein